MAEVRYVEEEEGVRQMKGEEGVWRSRGKGEGREG